MFNDTDKNLYKSQACRGLTRATCILCIEHPRPKASQSGIEPGTFCTSDEPYTMQRAIRMALLTAISNLILYYSSLLQALSRCYGLHFNYLNTLVALCVILLLFVS